MVWSLSWNEHIKMIKKLPICRLKQHGGFQRLPVNSLQRNEQN